ALLSAFKHMHQFRGDAQLSTWLGSIVLNAARMHLRRRINHNFVSLDDGSREEGPCGLNGSRILRPMRRRSSVKNKRVKTWNACWKCCPFDFGWRSAWSCSKD